MLNTQIEKDSMLIARLICSALIAIGLIFRMPFWYKFVLIGIALWGTFSIFNYHDEDGQTVVWFKAFMILLNFITYLCYAFYHSLPFPLKVFTIISFICDNAVICYTVAFKNQKPLYFMVHSDDTNKEGDSSEKVGDPGDNLNDTAKIDPNDREDIFYDPITSKFYYGNKETLKNAHDMMKMLSDSSDVYCSNLDDVYKCKDEDEDEDLGVSHIGEQFCKVTSVLSDRDSSDTANSYNGNDTSSSISCKRNLSITFRPSSLLAGKEGLDKDICFKSIDEMDEWIARRDKEYHQENGYCHMPLGPSKFDGFTYCVYGTNNNWTDMVSLGFFKVEYL